MPVEYNLSLYTTVFRTLSWYEIGFTGGEGAVTNEGFPASGAHDPDCHLIITIPCKNCS